MARKRETYFEACERVLKDITACMHQTGTLKSSTELEMIQVDNGWYVNMLNESGGDPTNWQALAGIIATDIKGAYIWLQGYSAAVYEVTGITHHQHAPR
jgi:hypothetical protein